MQSIQLSGLFVAPIAQRIRQWIDAGKINEDDLANALSSDARAFVDHSMDPSDWAPLEDVEDLVRLVADQIGGEAALVDWSEAILESERVESPIEGLIHSGRSLVDAPGFVVSQASELLVRDADWRYEGGRSAFSVRLRGVSDVSPALKSLLGGLLARLAESSSARDFDVRFDGIDGEDLVVFGEVVWEGELQVDERESRLHQAALIA